MLEDAAPSFDGDQEECTAPPREDNTATVRHPVLKSAFDEERAEECAMPACQKRMLDSSLPATLTAKRAAQRLADRERQQSLPDQAGNIALTHTQLRW